MKLSFQIKFQFLLTTTIAFVVFFLQPGFASASSIKWNGGGNNSNWNNSFNWQGGVVPGSSDIAVFDGTCSSNCSPTINTNVSLLGMQLNSGFTGTITQSSRTRITVGASGYSQAAGTFAGGDNIMQISGSFSLSGGTFAPPTSPMGFYPDGTVRNSIPYQSNWNVTGDFTLNGGTLNGSGKYLALNGTGNATFTCSGNFNSLTGLNQILIAKTVASGNVFHLVSGCTLTAAMQSDDGGNPASGSQGDITIDGVFNSQRHAFASNGYSWASGSGTTTVTGTINFFGDNQSTWSSGSLVISGGGQVIMDQNATNTAASFLRNSGSIGFVNGIIDIVNGTLDASLYGEMETSGVILEGGSATFKAPQFLLIDPGSGAVWSNNGGSFLNDNGKVEISSSSVTITGSTTFYNLFLDNNISSATLNFGSGAGDLVTVQNLLKIYDTAGTISLRSNNTGTQWKIDPQGTTQISNADVKDSNNINTLPVNADSAVLGGTVNSGNNTGWDFSDTAGTQRVWSGGGGNSNWSNPANWTGGSVPTTTDVAIFNNTCGGTCNATIDTDIHVLGIDLASGYTGTVTQGVGKNVYIGRRYFNTGGTPTGLTLTAGTFAGSSGDLIINFFYNNGGFSSGSNVTVNGGTYTGGSGKMKIVSGSFSISSGSFTPPSGGFEVDNDFTISGGTVVGTGKTLTFTDDAWTLNNSGAGIHNVICTGNFNTLTGMSASLTGFADHQQGGGLSLHNGCTLTLTDINDRAGLITIASGSTINVSGTWLSGEVDNSGTINYTGAAWNSDLLYTSATGSTNMPNATSFIANGILVDSGGTISYPSGSSLTVTDNFENHGTFNISGKDLILGENGSEQTALICTGNFNSNGVNSVTFQGDLNNVQYGITIANGCQVSATVNLLYGYDTGSLNINGTLNVVGNFNAGEDGLEGGAPMYINGAVNLPNAGTFRSGSVFNSGTFNAASSTSVTIFGDYSGRSGSINKAPATASSTMNVYLPSDSSSDSLDVSSAISFTLGAGTINLWGDFVGGSVFNAGTGSVNLIGQDQYIFSDSTFYNLTKKQTSPSNLIFDHTATQTISSLLDLEGLPPATVADASGSLISLSSLSSPTQWNTDSQGSRILCYLNVQDGKNLNASQMSGTTLVNAGNNTGWDFASSTPSDGPCAVVNGSGGGGGGGGGGGSTTTTDVSLTKVVDKANASVSDTLIYTLVVKNNGSITASSVSVSDIIPSGLILQSTSTTAGAFSGSTWTIGDMATGTSATMTLTTLIGNSLAGSTVTNTGTATTTSVDSDPTNNTASASTVIASSSSGGSGGSGGSGSGGGGGSGTGITPSSTPPSITPPISIPPIVNPPVIPPVVVPNVCPPQAVHVPLSAPASLASSSPQVVYHLEVINSGGRTATTVKVTEILPKDLLFLSAIATVGSYNPATGLWTIGNLVPGQSAKLTLTTILNPGAQSTTIVNTACVSSNSIEKTYANNSSNAVFEVRAFNSELQPFIPKNLPKGFPLTGRLEENFWTAFMQFFTDSLVKASASAQNPSSISIPALDLNAPVQAVGLDSSGNMQAPSSATTVGWYSNGTLPGQAGNAVIAGHLDTVTDKAVFWNLKKLAKGDVIEVTNQAGVVDKFEVTGKKLYDYKDTKSLPEIFGASSSANLNLITCAGQWLKGQHSYSQRLVVFSKKIN